MTTLLLTALALALAGPVPALMAARPRLRLTPMAAMVLWQAVALAAVLAALGAGLSLATRSGVGVPESPWSWVVVGGALVLTLTVLVRLGWAAHRVGTELRSLRRRHRDLLDALGEADVERNLRILDHDTPTAYCLPGVGHSRVVLSRGALIRLSAESLRAVLEHERAHLRYRHDLVLEAFTVLHRAFPTVLNSSRALAEVVLLAEVLADRAAIQRVGKRPLVEALAHLAGGTTPQASLAGGGAIVPRLEAMRDPSSHRVQSVLVFALAWAILVLPTFLVALPWLRSLSP